MQGAQLSADMLNALQLCSLEGLDGVQAPQIGDSEGRRAQMIFIPLLNPWQLWRGSAPRQTFTTLIFPKHQPQFLRRKLSDSEHLSASGSSQPASTMSHALPGGVPTAGFLDATVLWSQTRILSL